MGKTQGIVVGVVAAGLGVLVAQPLAGTAAVLPQHPAGAAAPSLTVPTAPVPALSTPKAAASAVSPSVATPSAPAPQVATPSVTVPKVTTPTVSTPKVTTPSVTTPVATVPKVTTPSVTTPKVTTPSVTTPKVTTPSVTTPKVGAPSVTTPKVSTPSVSSPAGTVPSVHAPSVTAPAATGVVRTAASNVSATLGAGRTGSSAAAGTPSSVAPGSGAAPSSAGVASATSSTSEAPALTSAERLSAMRAVGLGTGSRHARHQAVARENRRLRQLVSRLRGCLAALDPGARRLLDLRAGVGGPARSAKATARILHLSLRREAIRERQALKALTRSGATGCHGQPAAGTPAVATTGLPTLSSSPPSGPTAAKGNTKKMSRASYASNTPSGGSAANIRPSKARTEQAGTSGSFPSAYVTALLGLLLALAMVVAPKLRRRPASAMAGGAASSHGGRGNQAVAPGVVNRQALAQTAAARRPVTQVVKPTDPAIAPMAADAYASMAADDHSPEAADSDEAASTGPDPE